MFIPLKTCSLITWWLDDRVWLKQYLLCDWEANI